VLLYNHKQEFIGIDDEGLRLLNYSTLDELLNVCSDVADLFANEPGYIHNFKNFGWINFILHADSDASSAIVHANGRVFSCQLVVHKIHLVENPAQSGYDIEMTHIKTISGEDVKAHIITKTSNETYTPPPLEPIKDREPSVLPDYSHITPTQLSEPSVLDIPDIVSTSFDDTNETYPDYGMTLDELTSQKQEVKSSFQEPVNSAPKSIPTPSPSTASNKVATGLNYTPREKEYLSQHIVESSYRFDPQIASNELGLPVDLIEEFIGDFIQQSHDFKESLYESAATSDFNNLHILSHKLKGVAANLRIDDALETLSIINLSTDIEEVEANLKYYFELISKLAGEEITHEDTIQEPEVAEISTTPEVSEEKASSTALEEPEEIYSFGLKQYDDEPLLVQREEIELAEEVPEAPKESEFKKERLDLEDALKETPDEIEKVVDDIVGITTEKLPKFHYDAQSVASELGMDKSFFDELLFDYKNDANIMSDKITKAIIAFDTHTWKASAAQLKGISDNLRLSEISEELAILSKTNDAQEAKKASARLNNYLDQL
jgi:HPt (histidine-containing phosphotransfer) domain-containing protein